jgi:hypothetical protein
MTEAIFFTRTLPWGRGLARETPGAMDSKKLHPAVFVGGKIVPESDSIN